jgi:glutaredoxin
MARAGHTSGSGIVAATDSDSSASELSTLAATVKPGEVVMYSTTECPYCTQAKAWLNQYGFAFTECNIGINTVCEEEFRRYGATGTPYLVVQRNGKQRHMKDGFDSDEFLAALQ